MSLSTFDEELEREGMILPLGIFEADADDFEKGLFDGEMNKLSEDNEIEDLDINNIEKE